jgi:hypothetical protein
VGESAEKERWEKAEHFRRRFQLRWSDPSRVSPDLLCKDVADDEDCGSGISWRRLQPLGRGMEY